MESTALGQLREKGVAEKHIRVLLKFATMQGEILKGRNPIKGTGPGGCEHDVFVDEPHRLHDLIRGIYVPKNDSFALSIMLTEKDTNYGKELTYFSPTNWRVAYRPPTDKRAKRDTVALKKCFDSNVPIGILRNVKKSVNEILGLGKIIDMQEGSFSIVPFQLSGAFSLEEAVDITDKYVNQKIERKDYSAPDAETTVLARVGQSWFRRTLISIYGGMCAFCGFDIEEFLIASHIIPYSKERENRLNPRNGILLCRMCDYAFENGYLLVTPALKIIKTKELVGRSKNNAAVASWISTIKEIVEPKKRNYGPLPDFIEKRNKLI